MPGASVSCSAPSAAPQNRPSRCGSWASTTRFSRYTASDGVRSGSDWRAVEALERAGRRRAALALVARPVLRGAIGVLRGRGEPEEAELPDLHARVELDRQRRDVRQLQRHVTAEAGVDEPGRRVGEEAQ